MTTPDTRPLKKDRKQKGCGGQSDVICRVRHPKRVTHPANDGTAEEAELLPQFVSEITAPADYENFFGKIIELNR